MLLALTAAACLHIHAVCDPQLDRLSAAAHRLEVMHQMTACEEQAIATASALDACLAPSRDLVKKLEVPRDPAFNESLCRDLLSQCPAAGQH
jgi:hypothetical protein